MLNFTLVHAVPNKLFTYRPMVMRILLLCLSAFFSLAGHAQTSRPEKLVAENGPARSGKSSAKAATPVIDYKTVSEEELFRLSKTAEPSVKVVIAQELVDRKSAKLTDLFKSYMTSDEIVKIKVGVIEYESNPASELYTALAHQKEKAERKKYYERTTTKGLQKELKGMFGRDYDTKWTMPETDALLSKLATIALADDLVAPRTLNTIFYTNNFKSKNYARVKFFASKYPTAEILATLANFKNPADMKLLTQYPQASYIAYSLYPHAAFFPSLEMSLGRDYGNPDFQNAVTAYRNGDAKAMLLKICANICDDYALKSERDDKLFQLYSVIEKRDCRLFDSVLKKIDGLLQ